MTVETNHMRIQFPKYFKNKICEYGNVYILINVLSNKTNDHERILSRTPMFSLDSPINT